MKYLKKYIKHICKLVLVVFFAFFSLKVIKCDFPINDFSGNVLSMASARNVDIQNLIFSYMLFILPSSFFIAYVVDKSKLYRKLSNIVNFDTGGFEKFFTILLCANLLLEKNNEVIFLILGIFILSCVLIKKFHINICIEKLIVVWITYLIAFSIPIFTLGQIVATLKLPVFILCTFISLIVSFVQLLQKNKKMLFYMRCFLIAGVIDVVLLAFFEICSLREKSVMLSLLLVPHIILFIYSYLKEIAEELVEHFYKVSYLYLSAMVLAVSVMPALGISGYIDFFEVANHGISIYECINGIGVPIIDNLDAHMLSATLPGIMYGYITGDDIGAFFALPIVPIGVFVHLFSMFALIILLKNYIESSRILLLLVFFPWSGMVYMLVGFILIGFFYWWFKKITFLKSIFIVLVFIASAFYRIDIGASFGLALLVMPLLVNLSQKNIKGIVVYIAIMCGVISSIFFLFYFVLNYLEKDIFNILHNILFAFSSNQHWAYGLLGNNIKAYLLYIIIPCIFAWLFIPVLKKFFSGQMTYHDWVAIFTYIVYIFSIPRSIVRHNIAESSAGAYAIPAMLFLVLLLPRLGKESRALLTVLVLCVTEFVYGGRAPLSYISMAKANVPVVLASIDKNEHIMWKVNEDDNRQINLSKEFCDNMLGKDETYFDFTNQSLFYAFNKRDNPIYVNQSPGMINSTRENQEIIVKRLEDVMPRFVFMPFKDRQGSAYGCYYSIDGIQNIDRYFLISEFISEHYRPFCSVGDFAVWCHKDDYNKLVNTKSYNLLDYNYALDTKHYLGEIPYLWEYCLGNVDTVINKTNICQAGTGYIITENDNVFRRKGFLVVTIESVYDGLCTMKIHRNESQEIEYTFNVKPGIHNYRIRISSDWRWFSDNVSDMIITSDANAVTIKNIEFQEVL